MRRKDPVTPELYAEVMARDGWMCVAQRLDPGAYSHEGPLTLDHVKDQPRMGVRAPSDIDHLVVLCYHHHLDGWATSHRPLLREYLKGNV